MHGIKLPSADALRQQALQPNIMCANGLNPDGRQASDAGCRERQRRHYGSSTPETAGIRGESKVMRIEFERLLVRKPAHIDRFQIAN